MAKDLRDRCPPAIVAIMKKPEFVTLVLSVPLESEDALQGYFLLNHEPQGFEERADGAFLVHLLQEEWNDEAREALENFITTEAPQVTLKETISHEEIDWNAEWESTIEPIKITDELVIAPSWKLTEAETYSAKYLIVIDPKMSFGTGHHETTRLCLQMIEHIDCSGKTVLDLGSGTGILAMYAIRRGASHAVAIDTDEWAFENAKENCERNGYASDVIDLRLGELSTITAASEKFDLIIANIHRNVLLTLAKEIASHHIPGGILILSGLLEYDGPEIIEAYTAAGYSLIEQLQENEWLCLRLQKQ